MDGDGAAGRSSTSVAAAIEATLLRADATPDDVWELTLAARSLHVRGVCVAPVLLGVASAAIGGDDLQLITVSGFPLGNGSTFAKVAEVEVAGASGADEIDAVMAHGLLIGGDDDGVHAEVAAIAEAAHEHGLVMKAVIDPGYLTEELLERAALIAVDAGADWVKTGTGYGPRATTPEDVALVRRAIGDRAYVKAAGGVRTWEQAVALLDAGADAVGSSAFADVLAGADARGA